ncbi:hypothetical protein [Cryptosporangium arvum]|jgi:hypothetical protein|uniref:hypothetical protein n=1 Tax=Cryptosporangium arvum TaxID=80871 RepID=UPI0004B17072|nr:hypothetical protein [Cryptosporangium arvum]
MTQVSSIDATTAASRPVRAPLAPVGDQHFAYVLQGLIGAQLARTSAEPAREEAPVRPAGIPTDAVTVGPNGPTTIGAFRFWHRVLPAA